MCENVMQKEMWLLFLTTGGSQFTQSTQSSTLSHPQAYRKLFLQSLCQSTWKPNFFNIWFHQPCCDVGTEFWQSSYTRKPHQSFSSWLLLHKLRVHASFPHLCTSARSYEIGLECIFGSGWCVQTRWDWFYTLSSFSSSGRCTPFYSDWSKADAHTSLS